MRALRIITKDTYDAIYEIKSQELWIMILKNINNYLEGNFIYRLYSNLFPQQFSVLCTVTKDIHEYYSRTRHDLGYLYSMQEQIAGNFR